jgi:ABC-type glycerol-3-phosphate transport system substrate-binding protein
MKKSLVVFAILSTMILAACGGKAVETVATDSTAVDSTEVVVDTVAVEEVVGGAEGVEVEAAQGEAVK